jgi:hypothetical protein
MDHIKVIERPLTAEHPFRSAVITAFLRFPSPLEVFGTVIPGELQPGCEGVGEGPTDRVKLKRLLAKLFLYDGSFSPPRLVRRPSWHRRGRSAR